MSAVIEAPFLINYFDDFGITNVYTTPSAACFAALPFAVNTNADVKTKTNNDSGGGWLLLRDFFFCPFVKIEK